MPASAGRTVDVVVPLARDPARVATCVKRVLESRNATPFDVIVIASDAGLARTFSASAGAGDARVRVVDARGVTDLDGLVDRAVTLHGDRDVVVLRSDADVHGDWLDRLAAHAAGPFVGVVGSFADASVAVSHRAPDDANERAGDASIAALDALFARVNHGQSVTVADLRSPCAYITRACLSAIESSRRGAVDAGDWASDLARRARDAGFDTRIAADVFAGGDVASEGFRDGAGRDLLQLFAGRVAIARLAASPRPAIVFVSHAWGGGIRRYMDDIAGLVRGRADVLYLEPADALTVKLYSPHGGHPFAMWFRLPGDLPVLAQTFHAIGVARLHFHHVHGLPRSILELPAASGVPYDCTLHDYYAICPQYHLADVDGRYCGEPDEAGCRACLGGRPAQWNLDVAAWRQALGEFVRRADRVIAPSRDVAERIGRHLPGVSIEIWPHPERAPQIPPSPARVVTLGALSREKGLTVVAACARDARARGLPLTFRVLGPTSEPLPRWPDASLSAHGSYDERALPQLLAAEHADVLFFPAQVPETYAYTLSVALATTTPIVASALGAFIERLEGRANVRLLPWNATVTQWNAALLEMARTGAAVRAAAEDSLRAI